MNSVDPSTAAHPVLWDMALIHRIFRTSFAELARVIPTVSATDSSRVEAVAAHLTFMLDGLTAHHTTEDELVWPVLHERARPSAAFVDRMEEQHHGIHDGLEDVRRLGIAWSQSPSPEAAAALTAAINGMIASLTEHLDEEERDVVPLIAEHITKEEWARDGRKAFDKFTPEQRFIALGQMLEVATPAEATVMLATLPVPVKVLWALIGRRRYRRYVAAFRGAPLPAGRP